MIFRNPVRNDFGKMSFKIREYVLMANLFVNVQRTWCPVVSLAFMGDSNAGCSEKLFIEWKV